jgi:hypothetical protein
MAQPTGNNIPLMMPQNSIQGTEIDNVISFKSITDDNTHTSSKQQKMGHIQQSYTPMVWNNIMPAPYDGM